MWTFLLTGGIAFDNPYPNPDPTWLSDKSWSEVTRARLLKGLDELQNSFETNISGWKKFYDLANPQDKPFPVPYDNLHDESMERLVILRCVRPDKLVPAIRMYIISRMGQSFVEPPPFDLQNSYDDSSNTTPLVFVLSPGKYPRMNISRTLSFNF